MRRILILFLLVIVSNILNGQSEVAVEKGVISYVSARHIYVKFASTEKIAAGDTLFLDRGGQRIPALLVVNKSSISCVCRSLLPEKVKVSTVIFSQPILNENENKEKDDPANKRDMVQANTDENTKPKPKTKPKPVPLPAEDQEEAYKENIRGRISISSYNKLSDTRRSHRMRYTFSMRANNIRDSKVSADSYITFRHAFKERDEVRNNLSRALKVYSLAVKYDIDKSASLSFGRKINSRISSMGAIDGFQFEKRTGSILLGGIAGSRPDYADYGFNPDLLQAGVYFGHISNTKNNYQQSTVAFVEQRNQSKTDRRFVYFQHSSNPLRNLSVFGSFEMDLYENIDEQVKNVLSLTNLYTSIRYRFSRMVSISLSYDNRKNIIYYESYKNFIDQLIDDETRQGLRFHVNMRPFKNASLGMSSSWRFQKNEGNVSRNLNLYVNIRQISSLNLSSTITANVLHTNFLESKILGIRFFKDIIPGKLNGDVYYRWVGYNYKNLEFNTNQHIAGINFSYRFTRKLGFYLYYEGIFDNRSKAYNRINAKIVQRF